MEYSDPQHGRSERRVLLAAFLQTAAAVTSAKLDHVSEATPLSELVIDSLAMVEILGELEHRLEVDPIPDESLSGCRRSEISSVRSKRSSLDVPRRRALHRHKLHSERRRSRVCARSGWAVDEARSGPGGSKATVVLGQPFNWKRRCMLTGTRSVIASGTSLLNVTIAPDATSAIPITVGNQAP